MEIDINNENEVKFENYVKIASIGQGSFSTVYLVEEQKSREK